MRNNNNDEIFDSEVEMNDAEKVKMKILIGTEDGSENIYEALYHCSEW
ncbi:MAG TPA: hypothetical protein PLN06_06345 [Bacteroidales bacterium]|nr:hypothetical protein [Bacteroidales bacterium]HQG36954.1 hypothetical protein [Bacteroidales bacterium]HQG52035.1 hypothetical protein [Bacteroidales bacterium]HQJ21210.1 hypothetical protein [Bacteroidales bacterium]HRC89555.1 hypothetical protein [Bacteroidales bacterium]